MPAAQLITQSLGSKKGAFEARGSFRIFEARAEGSCAGQDLGTPLVEVCPGAVASQGLRVRFKVCSWTLLVVS